MIGLEPITCWLQISCSAHWATSAYKWMEVDSNHRSNLQQIYSLPPLATREPIHKFFKWGLQGSNLWPSACKADALPAELRPHIRPRRDSNSRPPPWQGGALTNWATGPFSNYSGYIYPENYIQRINLSSIFTYSRFGYALDRLVTVSSMRYRTSTSALSTSSSSRGLTNLSLWDISSWGGLHA